MNKPLTIWIFQTGEPLHLDEGNRRPMRAMNLANSLVESGHKVVLWSSSFFHQEKIFRQTKFQVNVSVGLTIRLISSPGYNRNIGIPRLWDHLLLANNLARELRAEKTIPDVAFVGFPPIETAAVMVRWLSDHGVPCLIDVKDQWPDLFLDVLPKSLRQLGRMFLTPYFLAMVMSL